MKPFMLILYDIKRLFGHGKTVILAMLSPVPVLLLFATFLIPVISADNGNKIACAIYNEDSAEKTSELLNLIIAPEVSDGRAVVYPVKDMETGMNLVKEGKVAVFLHIPENTYYTSMSGEKAELEYYYSKEHSFDALIFYSSFKSTMSVFGQGIRIVYIAADIGRNKGITDDEILTLWEEGSYDLLNVHLNRGRIIGKKGVFSPGNDYYLRFIVGSLFAVCAYFASFPIIYLTGIDVSGTFKKRKISAGSLAGFYFARLISGTILIMGTFLIMYPVARIIRNVPIQLALTVFPAMLLTALTFSALAIFFGSVFKNGHSALWAGLYFGFVSMAGVFFMSRSTDYPKTIAFLMEISPLRSSISIFSNTLYKMVEERFTMDIMMLVFMCIVFVISGFTVYMIRGCKE